jgi:glycosyltransferase involved in cell wall biosynthesis/peptidoglycan/xylan/chitin deacetylase (PgdA/CDA1 family)
MLGTVRAIVAPAIPLQPLVAGCAPVLTYHACSRVPAPEIPSFDNITPERLYEHIYKLRRVVRLVPIDELAASTRLKGVGAITFDDGYKSVIEEALPVFEALDVPFTIFVNTFPLTGRPFWRHKVMYLINRGLAKECERFMQNVRRIPGQSFSAALKDPRNNTIAVEEEIDRFFEYKGLQPEPAEHFLSRPEDFAAHRLIWYGNHSHHHRVMASLTASEQKEEIEITRTYLAGIPGIQLSRCVALPFGRADQANRDTLAAVRESGYDVLLLNQGGVNRAHAWAMGVRVLERFSPTEAPIGWNVFREVSKTAARRRTGIACFPFTEAGVGQVAEVPGARTIDFQAGGGAAPRFRILELVNSLDTGGAERMASSLSLELQRMGHRVDIVCLREFGRMAVPMERFAASGVHLWKCGKKNGLDLRCVWKLARFLKSERVDIIHSHNPLVTHYAAAASLIAGTPLSVSTIHGTSTLELQKWAQVLFAASCRLTDRIVLVCRQVQQEFCRRFAGLGGRTTAIPNGIEMGELLGIARRAGSGEFVFGAVGRLVPVKDHHTLLAAFAKLHARLPSCRLEILGGGEMRNQLENLAATLGLERVVRFHGWSADIAGFLSRIDTFVLSSRSEGLPMTLLEAMAAGLPVVSTAVGGVPEVIQDAGCGWLACPGDPEDLAQKMALAVTGRDGRGERARSAALKDYSVESMAQRYAALFADALAGKTYEPQMSTDETHLCSVN